MRVVAFVTQKGGAGKTTLAACLSVIAAQAGERVIALISSAAISRKMGRRAHG